MTKDERQFLREEYDIWRSAILWGSGNGSSKSKKQPEPDPEETAGEEFYDALTEMFKECGIEE